MVPVIATMFTQVCHNNSIFCHAIIHLLSSM
uniref:Uncharacterized protein n=1 Tax=Arundo donax TaxID=35708 RepID=A0A0A8ZU04_ARUDO